MTLATSRNLTILGIAFIVQALAGAAIAVFDGNPSTNLDVMALLKECGAGVAFILAKGAASTGGTVNAVGTPVVDPAPPVPK